MVFAIDTRLPASRARMVLRGVVYQGAAVLLGLSTLGFGWILIAGAAGENRRTLYDEWAQVVVLAQPPAGLQGWPPITGVLAPRR